MPCACTISYKCAYLKMLEKDENIAFAQLQSASGDTWQKAFDAYERACEARREHRKVMDEH